MNDTIGLLLDSTSEQLATLYPPHEARTIAEWLLQHELNLDRMGLLQARNTIASEALVVKTQIYVERLLRHEPLQYVLAEAHFYGREFLVTPAVLIPRPETEELVQRVVKAYQHQPQVNLLDIGTGSGCIPLTLAAELPGAQVWGLDISADALAVARQNAEKLGQQVTWLQQDILQEIPEVPPGSLDAVISNPPYVLEAEKALMRENVLAHEPHLALFVPNTDPLLFYRRIAEIAPGLLKKGGRLFFEINEKYATATALLLESLTYAQIKTIQDLSNKDRIMEAVWPGVKL